MRKIVFLLSALVLFSAVSANETLATTSEESQTKKEENEATHEVESKAIFDRANEVQEKAKSEVLRLTESYKKDGGKIKNSTKEYHAKQKKWVTEMSKAWMNTAKGIDVQECHKYVENYENAVANAIVKVNECVDSTIESVDNFIENIDRKCKFIDDNVLIAMFSLEKNCDSKECRTKVKETAFKIFKDTNSEINSEIRMFKLKSIYYSLKLKFCPAIDDFKLWLQVPGYPVHKVRLCVRAKIKEAKKQ